MLVPIIDALQVQTTALMEMYDADTQTNIGTTNYYANNT